MLTLGAVLMAAFAVYYSYSSYAANHLTELVVTQDEAMEALIHNEDIEKNQVFNNLKQDIFLNTDDGHRTNTFLNPSATEYQIPHTELGTSATKSPVESAIEPVSPEEFTSSIFDNTLYYTVYPAFRIHPKYWKQPIWAGPEPYIHLSNEMPKGFLRVPPDNEMLPVLPNKTKRIKIPIINVDSAVEDLEILDLGDSKAYSNPDNVVGRIPSSSTPGAIGNAWFFGHLESPLKGEGNVFRRLPEIADYLRDGEPVLVSLESDVAIHLYQVKSTSVVHKDQLNFQDFLHHDNFHQHR